MGVPRADGSFGDCNPNEKRNYRTRCSAIISSKYCNTLIDTSPDLRFQLLQNNINQIDRVLYSHFHADPSQTSFCFHSDLNQNSPQSLADLTYILTVRLSTMRSCSTIQYCDLVVRISTVRASQYESVLRECLALRISIARSSHHELVPRELEEKWTGNFPRQNQFANARSEEGC